ncbi:MAG: hypothetical protein DMG54_08100 [Acidobacteria bacterium]|nr:MAG: hypothetical protein DMG54_08100 [Acidobacteriota bacterium]PYU70545.1 MAG: hypothetical protein DMG52_25255 [Acidobacteriota bacterium]
MLAGQLDRQDGFDHPGGFDQRVDRPGGPLRMSERAHLADVQLVKEDAHGVAVGGGQEIRAVQDGLPHTGVLVLCGDNYESPGGHVFQEKRVIAGEGSGAIAPGENGVLVLAASHPLWPPASPSQFSLATVGVSCGRVFFEDDSTD